jgi:hypothetical protein
MMAALEFIPDLSTLKHHNLTRNPNVHFASTGASTCTRKRAHFTPSASALTQHPHPSTRFTKWARGCSTARHLQQQSNITRAGVTYPCGIENKHRALLGLCHPIIRLGHVQAMSEACARYQPIPRSLAHISSRLAQYSASLPCRIQSSLPHQTTCFFP